MELEWIKGETRFLNEGKKHLNFTVNEAFPHP